MTVFHDKRTVLTPQLVIGAFLMLFGFVFALDALGLRVVFVPVVPAALMAIGIVLLVRRRDSRGRFWGIAWTAIGFWLLLNALGLMFVTPWELVGPLILLLVGAGLVSRAWRREEPLAPAVHGVTFSAPGFVPPSSPAADAAQSNPDGRVMLMAVMAESKRASNDNPFRGGEMTAIMGGCRLDLRLATIEPGQTAVLNLLGVMAGHEIVVPPGWSIAIDVVPVLAGIDDKRLPPIQPPPAPPPVLRVRGVMFMGNVVIRN